MQGQNPEERRESFRVDMNAKVAINQAPGDLIDAADCFPELHALSLMSQSNVIEQEITLYSERIKDLAVKKTLDLLRQKMTLIAKMVDIQTTQNFDLKSQQINISDGGCAISSENRLQVGQRVALALIFTPNYFALFVFASVSGVEELATSFRYHLTFEALTEHQQQGLLKHMFQAQTAAKKKGD